MLHTNVLRSIFIGASRSTLLRRFMAAQGLRLGASRFVAGETLDDFVPIVRKLNAAGWMVAAAILGEAVTNEPATREVVTAYREVLARLSAEQLKANVALKLTHLGLAIDEELATNNLLEILRHAARLQNFVRIDMEESIYVDATLRIYRRLRELNIDNVGIVLQAYLYRAPADLVDVLPLNPNVRLVKGAYLEPASIAYSRKGDVDAAYKKLIEQALLGGCYTAIATHDEDALRHAIAFTKQHAIARNRFEFQMLYGVRPSLARQIAGEGYRMRIAAPFGREWYPYFMRRLAERPANVAFIVGSMLRG